MMLEWAAEQTIEITTTAIDLEFLPTDTNEDRGVQNLAFVLQQVRTALMALTSYEAGYIVATSRKNPLEAWRRLQKRCDPTTGGRKRNLLRTIISPGRCCLLGLQAGIERWESYVSRYGKKLKDKLEIKLAGLESLVPEELEKHLILKSNRLRTFEDARLEIVTYVEAKFGWRIRDSKPSDTGSRGHSGPMDVDAVISLSSGKGKGSSSPRDGFLSAVEHMFNETAMHARARASNRRASKENKGKSKGRSKGTKGAKGSHKGKTSKTGLSGLENSKPETSSETRESAQTCTTDNSWFHGGWSYDEWNDGWSSVGWHEGWEQTCDTSASSFLLGSLDLGATSSPKRFERAKMNLDTGAAVNTFLLNFGPEGAGDGRFCRTASGEWIPDSGAWQFQGYDENGLLRSLNGRLTGAHKVLCSAAEIACKGRQDFCLGHDGGYMIPIHSEIGQGLRTHIEKLVRWHGRNGLIPVYLENNIFNFYLSREVQSTETNNVNNADHCLAKNCQQSGNEDGRAVRS